MCYKMAILVRSDIKMSKGKVLAQVSHAVVKATIKAYTTTTLFYKWQNDGEKIVNLKDQYWRFHLVWMMAQCADTLHLFTLNDIPNK